MLAPEPSRPAPGLCAPVSGRVSHLLHIFTSFAVGGPQVRFVEIANHLAGKYRHSVIALDGDTACAARLHAGADVRLIPLVARKSRGLDLGNLWRFRKILEAMRPDILLTYNWGAIEWALANRILPVARHLHFEDGFGPEEALGRQLQRRAMFRRIALGERTTIIVPSWTLWRLATETWRVDGRRVMRIPNGLDCSRFKGAAATAAPAGMRPGTGEVVIGAVGALRAEKNFARLVRCVSMMSDPKPRLIIAGDGPERDAIEAEIRSRELGALAVLAGAVEAPERIMQYFDVFALSSDTEQMPYVIMEAMAAGLPIVATDVGDVKSMVSQENRPFIVAPEQEAAFAAALARLCMDHAARRRIGVANRTRARREFDLAAMCNAYDALFQGRPSSQA